MLKKIGLFLFFFGCWLPMYAQQVSIELGPNKIPIETYFTISIRLKGTTLKQASAFPEIEGFQKSSRFSKKTTLKSGKNLLEEVHTQNYAALNEGTFVLRPFTMVVNGVTVKSPGTTILVGPISEADSLNITPPGAIPEVKPSLGKTPQSFLNLETSEKQIYTGEGLHVALYFYLLPAENGQLEFYNFLEQLPALFKQIKQPNVWEEVFEQTEILPDTVQVSKVPYLRYKLYEAVYYPLNTQNLAFPALTLKMIKYTQANDATFANEKRQSEIKEYTTEPEIIQVKPLPPHPLRESIPVGHYRLDETIDRTQVRLNQAVNYSFAVIGEGNISGLPTPSLQNLSALEVYPPQIKENLMRRNERISGSKLFQYSIVPKVPGTFPLSRLLQFIYFDPVRERYDTLTSRLTLKVSGRIDKDAVIGTGITGDFYKLIETEDNTLVSIHKFEELKLYTNLIVLLLLTISVYLFFRKR
ncbi:MAG: BatD family protein [Bacteroidota bacterium]|nr:BatD family protein [Bacteroidota bacterium]